MRFPVLSLVRNLALTFGLMATLNTSMAQGASEGIVVYYAQHASLTQAWANGFTSATGI